MLSIRTQDRMVLTQYNGTIAIYNNNIYLQRFEDDNTDICLGEYKTKERALEVLDEIERVCVGKLLISANPLPNKDHWVFQNQNIVLPKDESTIEVLPLVYQMPKS